MTTTSHDYIPAARAIETSRRENRIVHVIVADLDAYLNAIEMAYDGDTDSAQLGTDEDGRRILDVWSVTETDSDTPPTTEWRLALHVTD